MAAHLHDSVLQTLALIQRTEDPSEMVALARGQERALRTWLYGKTDRAGQARCRPRSTISPPRSSGRTGPGSRS